jgi:hypothetical protein
MVLRGTRILAPAGRFIVLLYPSTCRSRRTWIECSCRPSTSGCFVFQPFLASGGINCLMSAHGQIENSPFRLSPRRMHGATSKTWIFSTPRRVSPRSASCRPCITMAPNVAVISQGANLATIDTPDCRSASLTSRSPPPPASSMGSCVAGRIASRSSQANISKSSCS